jgi:hypothetical protein
MIRISLLVWALASLVPAHATTLGKASFDDLVHKSTGIVRARVVSSYSNARGSLIDTYYKIQVLDRWKGSASTQVEVRVPGGTFNGQQQNYSGAPQLTEGATYVFFLWTGPSGVTQLLGLSQGVLDVTTDESGNLLVSSEVTDALVVDSGGQPTSPQALRMKLSDFSSRVTTALKGAASAQ